MNGIELDRDELATVVMLLSAERVFGLAEVLPATVEERGAVFTAGLTRLRARGLVTGEAGKAIPDTGLMRLGSVVVDPRLVIVAEPADGGAAALHYADDSGYVSLEGDAVSGYRLGWVPDTGLLARRVLRFVGIDPQAAPTADGFVLTDAALNGATELVRAAEAGGVEALLAASGLAPDVAATLGGALRGGLGGQVMVIRLDAGRAEAARRAWVLATDPTTGWVGWRRSAEDERIFFEALSADRLGQAIELFAQTLAPARA